MLQHLLKSAVLRLYSALTEVTVTSQVVDVARDRVTPSSI